MRVYASVGPFPVVETVNLSRFTSPDDSPSMVSSNTSPNSGDPPLMLVLSINPISSGKSPVGSRAILCFCSCSRRRASLSDRGVDVLFVDEG